ncbi:carboxypeptidase M32 [Halolamina litorea]|uniref:Metal-dependent carboxypeptidase n=1 Tax=Halolamina litorea TaxID=1515593 RepID=A0ABD6BN05_9EURY|nr:carboxypeptidase M32 [Halolamina litorea]
MSIEEPPEDAPDAYRDLIEQNRRISYLGDAGGVLGWDQQVTMPEGGTPARAKQLSAISAVTHDLLTADEFEEALIASEEAADELDWRQQAAVREIRRNYDRTADVPGDLVEELSETTTENQEIWQQAKAQNDFEAFAPRLEKLRDLSIERAEHINPDQRPYDVLYEDGLPYISRERTNEIFDRLKEELVPLIDEITENGDELASPYEGGDYPEEAQEALSEAALDAIGYDRNHGRLDISAHPFTSGTQFDARVTTRYKPENPMDALTATIHEYGHASYMLGLPKEEYGTPLGQSLSSGVHESQSRFWENHVGRTKPFWDFFLPQVKEHLDGVDDLTAQEAYEAVNRIYPNNLIRVEADELTYHMHIILRCEIDSAFVAGEIEVDEIPELWNQKMEEYLGVTPDGVGEGCLQDIHWSSRFAGFQGYTIGSVLAAQLDAAMRDDISDVDGKIRNGNFEPMREWMNENVHSHGQAYKSDDLIEEATGEPLTADYFLDYVNEKFTDLYGL